MKTMIKTLAGKATEAKTSIEALQFSQAATNVGNAFGTLFNIELEMTRATGSKLTAPQIKHMVDRFLGWKLPKDFNPDGGISFKAEFNEHTAYPTKHEPSGTNLLDASQADAMVRYMLDGMPAATE